MIRITTATMVTTMAADITATGVGMREEVGIGTTIRMGDTRIVGTIGVRIVPAEEGVVAARLLLL